MRKKVLVFPAGTEIAFEIHNALKYSKFVELYGASSVSCHAEFLFKNYIEGVPFPGDPGLIDALNKIVDEYGIDLIYPAHDSACLTLTQEQDKLHCKVVTSPIETVDTCRSKTKTYEFFKGEEFIPKTFASADDVKSYPVFCKPAVGQGSEGAMKVTDRDDLEKLFVSQEWIDLLTDRSDSHKGKILKEEDGVTYIFGFPISNKNRAANKKQGILRGDSITSFLGRLTEREDSIDFDRLPIPFRCVAVDINTFKEVIFKEGSLPLAMRASMAIPLAFNTVQKNGMTLVDGGLLNNLPVDVAKEMGADYIIAVDLTVNKHEDAEPDITDDDIGGNNNLLNILKWITDRPDLAKYRKNVEDATIYISPDLAGFSAAQFSAEKIVEMIRRGEDAGKMALQPLVDLKNAL